VIFNRRGQIEDAAQIQAFEDTWHRTPVTGVQFGDVLGIVLCEVRAMDSDREMAGPPVNERQGEESRTVRTRVCRESGSLDKSIIADFSISDLTTGLNR
jgi:hypothetical protein